MAVQDGLGFPLPVEGREQLLLDQVGERHRDRPLVLAAERM